MNRTRAILFVIFVTWGPLPSQGDALTLDIDPDSVTEGSSATGTVARPEALGTPLLVTLGSSDTSVVTVPSNTTIDTGQQASGFDVSTMDNFTFDGTRLVIIEASAIGFTSASRVIEVLDDEQAVDDSFGTWVNSPTVFIDVLSNDRLPLNTTTEITSCEQGDQGGLVMFLPSMPTGLFYTPQTGFVGVECFDYTVTEQAFGTSDIGHVCVTVVPEPATLANWAIVSVILMALVGRRKWRTRSPIGRST